jgi:spermidine/putrescine-binding protein
VLKKEPWNENSRFSHGRITSLDFVLRPEVAAQEARYTRYATGNSDARALLDEAIRSDPSIYPPDEIAQKLEPGLPLNAACSARRQAIWKEVRG